MKGKKITASLLGCIILGITSMHAQITGTLPSGSMSATGKQLKMAKELFNNKLYQSALGEFNKLAQQCKEGYGKKNTDITEIESALHTHGHFALDDLQQRVGGLTDGMVIGS